MKRLLGLMILLAGLLGAGAGQASAVVPTKCDGKTATVTNYTIDAAGWRVYQGSAAADVIIGSDGRDKIYGGGGLDRICGAGGGDKIWGQDGNDRIWGNTGGDVIDGGSGNDQIYGGVGPDQLLGGAGEDTLQGGDGFDKLYGQGDDDFLKGGEHADQLHGGDGDDELKGEKGFDLLWGDGGNDILRGEKGDDTLRGGTGDDELYGNEGFDQLFGDSGNDTLEGGGNTTDRLNGGSGINYCGDQDQGLRNVTAHPGCHRDCSAGIWANTGGTLEDIFDGFKPSDPTLFECRYLTQHFEILYNVLDPFVQNPKITEADVAVLGTRLEAGYTTFTSTEWNLNTPAVDSVSQRIRVSLGGHNTFEAGFSTSTSIQLKPDSSWRTNLQFIYHELFHQFQWAHTEDDFSYVTNKGFFESMADYAAREALGWTPCPSSCVTELQYWSQKPWDPAYRGESFFEWGSVVKPYRRVFIRDLLNDFDSLDSDVKAVKDLFGIHAVTDYRLWTLRGPDKAVAAQNTKQVSGSFYRDTGESFYGGTQANLYRVEHSGDSSLSVQVFGAANSNPYRVALIPCVGAGEISGATRTVDAHTGPATFSLQPGAQCTLSYVIVNGHLGLYDSDLLTIVIETS